MSAISSYHRQMSIHHFCKTPPVARYFPSNASAVYSRLSVPVLCVRARVCPSIYSTSVCRTCIYTAYPLAPSPRHAPGHLETPSLTIVSLLLPLPPLSLPLYFVGPPLAVGNRKGRCVNQAAYFFLVMVVVFVPAQQRISVRWRSMLVTPRVSIDLSTKCGRTLTHSQTFTYTERLAHRQACHIHARVHVHARVRALLALVPTGGCHYRRK